MADKIVEYETYCQRCRHFHEDESDPKSKCWVCLDEPVASDSRRPLYFEEEKKL